jgi:myo-inositol 2-dehydrogenase/D-chiro-inositol 1-dehydrogenase
MIRVGVFGAGRMAADHIRNVAHSRIARIEWIVDPNERAGTTLAAQYSCKHFARPEDALAKNDVDAFVIVTPSHTHFDLIKMVLELGKPIFCEKPVAVGTDQVRACVELLNKKHVPFVLGFNRRFDQSISALQARVRAGEVGEIQMIDVISRDHPVPPIAYLKTSGGMFYDMTIHDFDMARWLMGEDITEVFATGSALILPELTEFGDIDSAYIVLKTASGKMARIGNSRFAAFGYDQRIEVFGQKGLLRCENLKPTTIEMFGAEGSRSDKPYPGFSTRYVDAYRIEMEHFLEDVVASGKAPLVSAIDGLRANLIADAATRSLKSGKMENVA